MDSMGSASRSTPRTRTPRGEVHRAYAIAEGELLSLPEAWPAARTWHGPIYSPPRACMRLGAQDEQPQQIHVREVSAVLGQVVRMDIIPRAVHTVGPPTSGCREASLS
jgi:hypothetical protein